MERQDAVLVSSRSRGNRRGELRASDGRLLDCFRSCGRCTFDPRQQLLLHPQCFPRENNDHESAAEFFGNESVTSVHFKIKLLILQLKRVTPKENASCISS